MAYISSSDNRYYVSLESSFGEVGSVTAANRIAAVKLSTRQKTENVQRKDKTGSRTFAGNPAGLRRETSFQLKTYMTGWTDQTSQPAHGPLFQACLGSAPLISSGGTVASMPDPSRIVFNSAHGLTPGQAISTGGEIRFVSAVVDDHTVQINAPFSTSAQGIISTGPTATYAPARDLKSVSIFDYWSPGTAVQRILCGAALDKLTVKVNGDFHEFDFVGQARDLLDSASFQADQSGLSAFPAEPSVGGLNYSIIPGHLGQVWLGSTASRFYTLTDAEIVFDNNLELRAREFGADLPMAVAPGIRAVGLSFSLYQQDDSATQALYQAAKQQSPISVMLQLGQQQGQLFGIYMKSVVPEVPDFDDSQKRQQWQFQNCKAQGSGNDEVFVAFG
jgi:hypothetical protein